MRLHRILTMCGLFLLPLVISVSPIAVSTLHNKPLILTSSELTKDARRQVECLAKNIYYEAGYEPKEGKIAVALVTLNRSVHPEFPSDLCEVVSQKKKNTCQFSWYCETKKNRNELAFEEAKRIALYVYANYERMRDITGGAIFYHADYVNVRKIGVQNLQKTAVIGRHIFYKEKVEI